MDPLDEIRRKKLEELYREQMLRQEEALREEEKLKEQVLQLEASLKAMMTKEAATRYGALKTAHPEKALNLLVALARLVEARKLAKITDELVKDLLRRMEPPKRETRIIRK